MLCKATDEWIIEERKRMKFFMGNRLHGKFLKDASKVADTRSWQWLRAGYLRKSTKGYVFAAQEQALWTRFFHATIEWEDVEKKVVESVGHLASGLAQREYHRRHDHMGLRV